MIRASLKHSRQPSRGSSLGRVGRRGSARNDRLSPSAREPSQPVASESPVPLAERVKAIMVQEIAFIHNPSFSAAGAAGKILKASGPLASVNRRTGKAPSAVPAYFAALYETPLLSPAEEVDLFRRMNFLKFLANAKRSKLNPRRPDQKRVAEIEDLLAQARDVRNRIIEANLRLVVSIARRLAADHYPFDDIVSDGNLALVRGIEKFDFARGFRFSTYATHVIQRELYRQSGRRRDQGRKTIFGVDDWLAATPDDSDPEQRHSQVFQRWQKLQPLMEQELTDREQDILAMRVGLDVEQGPQTLQSIGSKLGISKERVRQLERRAIERLQMAAEGFAARFSGDDSASADPFVRES